MGVRASLIELYNRAIKLAPSDNHIYHNGEDNLYPNKIERIINNSPTAFSCAKIMAKYIAGLGVEEDIVVNEKKGLTLSDIIHIASSDIAYQYGVFFHISYKIEIEGSEYYFKPQLDILDYDKCRVSKEDDNQNKGKIYYKDYEETKGAFGSGKTEAKFYYPYSSNKEVIKAQIKSDAEIKEDDFDLVEAIKNYRGQVLYLNLSPRYQYALSLVDSVYNDADSEYRFSLYTNGQMRGGFLGKIAVITSGLDEEETEAFKEEMKDFLGAEEANGMFHMDVDNVEDVDKVIAFKQLPAQFDDKLFEVTNTRIKKNILSAFNNIPEPLINAGDGALFGTNSETYKEMKRFYNEQTSYERDTLQKTLCAFGFDCKIIPIVEYAQQQQSEAEYKPTEEIIDGE